MKQVLDPGLGQETAVGAAKLTSPDWPTLRPSRWPLSNPTSPRVGLCVSPCDRFGACDGVALAGTATHSNGSSAAVRSNWSLTARPFPIHAVAPEAGHASLSSFAGPSGSCQKGRSYVGDKGKSAKLSHESLKKGSAMCSLVDTRAQ